MYNLTPTAIELLGFVEDGEDTRHFQFRLLSPDEMQAPEPGQFFMLAVPGVGEAPFTFTTAPDQRGQFGALIRRMGSLTNALFDCQGGARLGARGPYGRGWPMAELIGKNVLIVAGGCGLAPLVQTVDKLIELRHGKRLTLVYGARNPGAQMMNPERLRWREHIAVFDIVEGGLDEQPSVDAPPETTGTPLDIMPEVLATLKHKPDALLLCGPEVMMCAVAEHFVEIGLNESNIWLSVERRMHCALGSCGHCYVANKYACSDGPCFSWSSYRRLIEQ